VIRIEIAKQWRRPRTALTLAATAAFAVLLVVALQATGAGRSERVGDIPLYIVPAHSGFSLPIIALASTMKFFLPLAVAIFAGESVAGEASWGSLRYALARPISRARFLASKFAVALGLSAIAVLLVPAVAVVIGALAFGWHPLVAVDGSASSAGHVVAATFAPAAALGRLGLGTLYVAAGMLSIFSFAFLLSTLTSRPFVAVAGGVGLTILSRVINADYLPGVADLSPYMPNNDVDLWQHMFQNPADTSGMVRFLVLQAVYCAVFLPLAWWVFCRKDIVT
jgi:ABC-2 type transport system permease protein